MSSDLPNIPPHSPPSSDTRLRLLAPAALILGGALFLSAAHPDGPGQGYLAIGYLLGTMYSHATLAAAWTAFGPGHFLLRLPLSLLWLGLVAVMVSLHGPGNDLPVFLATVLGAWLVLQLPFGLLVLLYRLRLATSNLSYDSSQPMQFGIRQFMVFTAIVSVVLALGRVGVNYLQQFPTLGPDGPIFLFLAVAGILMTLPLILAALLPRFALPSVLVVLALIGVGTFTELPLLKALGGAFIGPDMYHFIWINAFTVAWILGIAGLLRWAGYRLSSRSASTHV